MNARGLRRLMLGLPNDAFLIGTATFQCRQDINDWRPLVINVATCTVTLPNATGSGSTIWFIIGIAATSQIIKTNGTDTFQGMLGVDATASTNRNVFTAGGTKNITLNGTTQGGANVGDQIFITDMKSGVWSVEGQVVGSGSIATPFS